MLEITEGVLIDNPDEMLKRIDELHALGVRIALDDFGSGYSNLTYLQRFPLDKLKIDKSFVSALGTSSNGGVIIQAIVALGRALGLTVLVEGVETEQQRVLLRLAGCDEMQGFLFARPAPAKAIDRLLAQAKPGRALSARAADSVTRKPIQSSPICRRRVMIPNAWAGFDFGLGPDVEMLRKSVHDFAQDRIAPRADEIDRDNTFPRELWPQMGALGLLGITVEEEYGGAGLGYLEHCVAMEEISRASAAVGLSYGAHSNLCVNQMRRNGTRRAEAQIPAQADLRRARRRAGDVGAGRRLRRGVDAHPRRQERRPLRSQRLEDVDHQRAGGRHAGGLRQDRPHRRRARHHRLHRREGLRRVSPPRRSSTSSACAAPTPRELVFEDCEVPEENVLGAVGNGVNVLMSGLDYERVVLAAGPLGIMQACLDVVIPYVHERKQFGQPIGRFQLMQAKLADMYVTMNAAKSYVYAVANACDDGRTTREDAAGAILYAAERATWMALEAIQCLGGNGYINDFPAGRLLRDAKLYEIGAGTSEIRRMLIGREIFEKTR